ncbi:putative F-box protein At3g16210 [Papaver somniferum]|uniref:putative F-box protein At3g16210 n=1 Tax=Papaver somniferum TaxID=3469 RepID=UPI000E6FFF2C|nr:putative F-box protein At3g16210 [Papaver somniferum]
MVNILSRLPAESALACRQVCRAWRNLFTLDDKYFSDMHLRAQQQQTCNRLSFIFLDASYSIYNVDFDDKSRKKLTRINFPLPTEITQLVSSCNGLVCFGMPTEAIISSSEYLELPKFLIKDEGMKVHKILSGFGYVPSSNEYKVVRIIEYYDDNERLNSKLQVYTLGAGSVWRDKGKFDYRLIMELRNVFVNGALHWLDWTGKIVPFGLVEEFYVLFTWFINFRMVREVSSSSTGRLALSFSSKTGSRSRFMGYAFPLAVTKRGEVLIAAYNNKNVVVATFYDPKTATFEKIGNLKNTMIPGLNSVSHVHSFVSLKRLDHADVIDELL